MDESSLQNDFRILCESVQDGLSNAMFITGPPGVGKTALVYYIARILGYTVLEVNSSSERSGRRVLADLQEATQSLHVEGTNMSPSKGVGSFFRPVLGSTRVAGCAVTKQPKERNGPRAVRREKSVGGSTLSTNTRGTISSFFSSLKADKQNNGAIAEVLQISDQSSNEVTDCTANGTKGERRSSIKSFFKSAKKNANREPFEGNRARHASARTDACSQTLEKEAQKIKCSKSTIILFDDIDVIFDDDGDEGFWVALETMLRNSKKPCILTATRDYDSIIKRCRPLQNVPVVQLHRPSPTQVAALLKKIGKTENRDLSNYSVNFMCQYLASDVRRTLLQIEFETISPGLKQTIYPIDRSLGSLLTSGYNCVNQAISIQTAFKKSGFNAFYASLEQCLPFKFEDIVLRKPSSISPCTATFVPSSESRNHYEDDHKKIAMTRFHSDTLNDLSEVFDKLAQFDVFTGCLDRMGEECLPNYERAKRWMEQRPFEFQDVNPRISEELLEIGSTVLIASVIRPLKKISERCAALDHSDQLELHLPRVASSLEFHNIHKKLKRVRTNERALEDVLSHFPVGRPLARDYLFFLTLVCEAEAERRGKPNGKRHNRFLHYLPQIGLSLGPEQIERIANLWV
ncbi:hypothetical protein BIW11_01859 [Tropilaelaps mercedesae]|uniref:AAA+ ATPase domain-containing protein n=1 Tax=Tropilaelaps mercedesae TaxID=418985 RepID=A0A1V9X7M3_9ACAR|nr:hypothetical protein BIW11_01859 [Tropilaelaps mercedesae]